MTSSQTSYQFDANLKTRTSSLASNSHQDWQIPDYYSHSDSTAREIQSTVTIVSPNHRFEAAKSNNYDSSQIGFEHSSEGTRLVRCPFQYEQEKPSIAWGTSWIAASNYEETHSPCADSEFAITPCTPSDSRWISLAESAHGSNSSASHGGGSSEAESMMDTSCYFAYPDSGNPPDGDLHTSAVSATNSRHQANSAMGRGSATKAAQVEHKDRLKQDAHSKVEKRYRMSINNQINQLRLLINNLSPEEQVRANTNQTTRRKSGTELSKRDVLTRAISQLEHLHHQVEILTSQNTELKRKLL